MQLDNLQRLYDENRFLEAFRQTADSWKNPPPLESLSVDELILGGRLASRLGGWRSSRWLLRAAYERDSANPRVRYFTYSLRRRRWSRLDDLRQLEASPDLDTDDPKLQSSWLAWTAVLWASFRDFTRAHDGIERARALYCQDGWVSSCESDVLGIADLWEESVKSAELAWELSAGAPFAARSLGNGLLHLGRVGEAAHRLGVAAERTESYEVVAAACWHCCALAETLEGGERLEVVHRAQGLAERLPGLAPLADRESRALFARVRLDLAQSADDREQMELWAKELRSPFFHMVLSNLKENPGGSRIRLPFRRDIQKHLACLPTSIGSALAAMEVHIGVDVMAAEVTFGGTSDWAAADWLERRGFKVRFFIVTPALACELIRNGIAFVMGLEGDDFAHAVAVVGLDEAAGTLLVHDPELFRTNESMLEGLGLQAPLGPKGMATVPAERLALLDGLLDAADVEVMTASQSYHRALQLHGTTAASAFVTDLLNRHPSHPVTRLLRATQAAEEGRAGEALAGFQELLASFPGYPSLRAKLLHACRSLGNTALLRDMLKSVVEQGILPGVQSQQDWVHPPSGYVCQYADLLRLSATTKDRARQLLHSVLRREATCADAWHVLGDLLWHERDAEGALLSYRLASCLAESNDRYAAAYSEALGVSGHVDEGLGWLESRVRTHGASPRAVSTWIAWVSALETWGRPERAQSATHDALREHGSSPELLSFAVGFFARMGQWEEAEHHLARLQASANLARFLEAGADFHRMRGDLDASLRHAEGWVGESPLSMRARGVLLGVIAAGDGPRASLERAARWHSDWPGHDGFEALYCAQLDVAVEPSWKKALVLRRRLSRNSEDGWAWRELASVYFQAYEGADAKRRGRMYPRIEALIAECRRTAPDDAATIRAKAMWFQVRGEWREAVAAWLESVDRDPGVPHGYRRAWECSATFDGDERRRVWERMETILHRYPGRLPAARELIQLAALRFGVAFAEEAASRWKDIRESDPEITLAACDLLLEYGHGHTDTERACSMLERAVERFPFHGALRFSLLRGYRELRRFAEAERVVRELMRRHPANAAGHIQFAWIHELAGRRGDAREWLESAIPRDPQNAELPNALVQLHIRNGRFGAARRTIQETRERLPRHVSWLERSVVYLLECGEEREALQVARDGVVQFPRVAYVWYLLGNTLDRLSHFAATGEIEACYRRSLELNQSLGDAADRLAVLLAAQRRFEEAETAIRGLEGRLSDPSAARGRLAWIHRERGNTREALEEMVALLGTAPWYQWGWRVLMGWLHEDRAWERARSLLGTIPPEIRTYPHLAAERLRLLEKAGLGRDELDAEWNQLLIDFSEDFSLHQERYDSLRDSKRFDEAATVLRKIQSLDPDHPFVNARLVEILARERKKDEAVGVLVRIFFAAVEKSDWPVQFAWNTVRSAGFVEEAFQAIDRSLKEGARPTPHAVTLWASYSLERAQTRVLRPQSVWRTRFPDPGARNVMALLEVPWVDGRYRARLFSALSDFGYSALVVRYWRGHRAEVESYLDCWAETSRALIGCGRKREARVLMTGWRDRPGVSMWMAANYVISLSGVWPAHLREVRSACADALGALPHDRCARYLAHVHAEACALMDDRDGFRRTWNAYPAYFQGGGRTKDEWFQPSRVHLLTDIPTLARHLERGHMWAYRTTLWRLRLTRASSALASSVLVRRAKQIWPFLFWLLIAGVLRVLANF